MMQKRIAQVSLVVGLLTALFIVGGSTVGQAEPPRNALVGSWLETATFPPGTRPPIKALSTYHGDGTLVVSDQGSVTTASPMPGVFTAGHGVWKHLEKREFAYTQIELISDLSGNLVGYLKVRGVYDVSESGNEYNGTSFAEIVDLMQLPQHWLAEVENFFEIYKALEEKMTATGGWKGGMEARQVLRRRQLK